MYRFQRLTLARELPVAAHARRTAGQSVCQSCEADAPSRQSRTDSNIRAYQPSQFECSGTIMNAHRDLIEEAELTARLAQAQRQAIDLLLIEFSRIERAAMAAIAARTQREQLGTAFQPDPDEAGR